jgi:hypothetical protein
MQNLEYLQGNIRSAAYATLKDKIYQPRLRMNYAIGFLRDYLAHFKTAKKYLNKFWKQVLTQHANASESNPVEALFADDLKKKETAKRIATALKTKQTRRDQYRLGYNLFQWLIGTESHCPISQYESVTASTLLEFGPDVKTLFNDCQTRDLFAIRPDDIESIKGYPTINELIDSAYDGLKFIQTCFTSESYLQEYLACKVLIEGRVSEYTPQDQNLSWWVRNRISSAISVLAHPELVAEHFQLQVNVLADNLRDQFEALPTQWACGYNDRTIENLRLSETLSKLFSTLYRPYVEEASRIAKIVQVEDSREREEKRALGIAQAKLDNAEKIAAWRLGSYVGTLPYDVGYLLRIKNDTVQSNRGCDIPIKFARAVWSRLVRYLNGELSADKLPRQWGAYSFHPEDNTSLDCLVVGCHRIPREEVFSIAAQLGLPTDLQLAIEHAAD